MVRILVIAVLFSAALAQNSIPPENNSPLTAAIVTGPAQDPVEPAAPVAPSDPVLTIHGTLLLFRESCPCGRQRLHGAGEASAV